MSPEMKDTIRDMASHPFRTLGEFACMFSIFALGWFALVIFGQGHEKPLLNQTLSRGPAREKSVIYQALSPWTRRRDANDSQLQS